MAHTDAMAAKPGNLAIIKVDAMGKPGAGGEPAGLFQIIDRAALVAGESEGVLVMGLGQMGVQWAIIFLR